jgi:outer membrane receptor protein involved in Fe transport
LALKIFKNTTWKASVSKGFRSPTIRELFIWNHNSNLDPESLMNYETSILQTLWNNKLNIEITGFIVKGDNMIVTIPSEGLQNAGEVFNKGIEFAAKANPAENLAVNITYSYTHMENPVYATPEHNLYAGCTYNWEKLRASVNIQHINNLDSDPSVSDTSFETYTLLNANIAYRILNFAELFIRADNILDQEYVNNIYYTMPGITIFGGIKIKL